MTLIPEYIIVMTWALAAVIIVAIIAAIFFRLYIMFLSKIGYKIMTIKLDLLEIV